MPKIFFVPLVLILFLSACQAPRPRAGLPYAHQIIRDQLVILSDFRLPSRHRLLDELVASREDICFRLGLPPSDEPIIVYLFEDEPSYRAYMRENFFNFPDRRAIFVQDDTSLKVYAYWGERVAEDLRHEVSHGYLHSVVPNLPLWLDEGLAEYFEVGRGRHGFHRAHVAALSNALRNQSWTPEIQRLERLQNAEEMTQLEYAESWLWVHFLLESTPKNLKLVQDQLARLRMAGEAGPLAQQFDKELPDATNQLIEHLRALASEQETALVADGVGKLP